MSGAYAFSAHDVPPAGWAEAVDQGLGDFNEAAAPSLHEVRGLSVFVRTSNESAGGAVLGGAVGRTWGRCCELLQLWVAAEHRRNGLGRALLGRFHTAAEARGCTMFYLTTFSFQAPWLYRSAGYRTAHEICGFGPGISKHLMVRELGAKLAA